MVDGATLVRDEFEVDRLTVVLADKFQGLSLDEIRSRVREELARWSAAPVRDFVPILVERAVRGTLRTVRA